MIAAAETRREARAEARPAEQAFKPTPAQRDYISYSALSTYRMCPLRYRFKYVVGLPEATVSASLALGAAIHSAVEFHFRQLLEGNEPPSLDELMAVPGMNRKSAEAVKANL